MVSVLWLGWVQGAAAVECVERRTREDLDVALGEAEASFEALDDTGFRDHVNEVAGLVLPCLAEPIPTPLAARYHRLMAVHLYALGDTAGASLAITAAKEVDPTFVFADAYLPPEHDLRVGYAAASEARRTRKVPEPRTGTLAFDGIRGRERPVEVPTLFQRFDGSGFATETAWLGPRDPLPTYAAIPRKRNTLIAASAGAAGLAVGAYVGAWAERAAMFDQAADPTTPAADLDRLRGATNVLTALSGVGLVAAVGLGAGAVAVGAR